MQFHVYIIPVLEKEYFLITLEKCRTLESQAYRYFLHSGVFIFFISTNQLFVEINKIFARNQFETIFHEDIARKTVFWPATGIFPDEARYLDKRGRTNRSRTDRFENWTHRGWTRSNLASARTSRLTAGRHLLVSWNKFQRTPLARFIYSVYGHCGNTRFSIYRQVILSRRCVQTLRDTRPDLDRCTLQISFVISIFPPPLESMGKIPWYSTASTETRRCTAGLKILLFSNRAGESRLFVQNV